MRKMICFFMIIFSMMLNGFSIHQEEYEKHRNEIPVFKYNNFNKKAVRTSAPILNKRIFGYFPYWTNGTDDLRYSLLTDLLYFSCGASSDGSLSCNGWPDSAPITEAHSYGLKVHLVITAFSSTIVSALLNSNGSAQQTFFENAYNTVKNSGADGLNIDFESFGTVEPATLAQFFSNLSYYFKSRDSSMIISVALPAVDWNGNWDLELLNDVDYFFIMLYDFHYSGSNPGPCAPLVTNSPWNSSYNVTSSIESYVNNIGLEYTDKIIAGYPYYGRKWKSTSVSVPGTKIESGTSVLYSSAVANYQDYSEQWDNGSQTPYKTWSDGTNYWQLWYDSAESTALKFDLVNQYNLGGSGMWALNYDSGYEDLWKKIADAFTNSGSGSAENPINIISFPFEYSGDTYYYRSDIADTYVCSDNDSSTAGIDESGPELWFSFVTECSGTLTATVTEGAGGTSSREDIDIHLLSSTNSNSCIKRSDSEVSASIETGKYYLSADSYVSSGIVKGGPFSIKVIFEPDEINECDNNPCSEGYSCFDKPCGYLCVAENDDDTFTDEDIEESDEDFVFVESDEDDLILDSDFNVVSDDTNETADEDITASVCEYDGIYYSENDKWRDRDGCNICSCQKSEVYCTVNMCEKDNSSGGCSMVLF